MYDRIKVIKGSVIMVTLDYLEYRLDNDSKLGIQNAVRELAHTYPECLSHVFKQDALVIAIKETDRQMGSFVGMYNGTLDENVNETEEKKAYNAEVRKIIARDLSHLFQDAERIETALRGTDYIYGYETDMPSVSAIVSEAQKEERTL